jgi:regulator of sirC expression with transglutaminase-like and TPR domain
LSAQKQKREPLTEAQVEKIAEAGIDPNARIALYTQYLNEHAEAIKALSKRASSEARSSRMSDALEDFTALMDELGDNLDMYSDRKADIRKSLEALTEATPRWQGILRALAGEAGFSLARKEAIESGEDLSDQAKRLLQEQKDYFKQHPDEVGQDRWEPK